VLRPTPTGRPGLAADAGRIRTGPIRPTDSGPSIVWDQTRAIGLSSRVRA